MDHPLLRNINFLHILIIDVKRDLDALTGFAIEVSPIEVVMMVNEDI